MECSLHKCLIPFSDGGENYKEGDDVLVLIGLCTKDYFMVGTDMHVPVRIERKYISSEGRKVFTGEPVTV